MLVVMGSSISFDQIDILCHHLMGHDGVRIDLRGKTVHKMALFRTIRIVEGHLVLVCNIEPWYQCNTLHQDHNGVFRRCLRQPCNFRHKMALFHPNNIGS